MNNIDKEDLEGLIKVSELPLNIGKIQYQPTTGNFYQDNNEIAINRIVVTKVLPLSLRFVIEQEKKVVTSRIVNNEDYKEEELLYIQDMLEQEGYKIYQTKTLAFAAHVNFNIVKRQKKEVIISKDNYNQFAIININSGTQMPGIALSSMMNTLHLHLNDDESIVELALKINASDEPFVTKNTGREIYQVLFESDGRTSDEVIQSITKKKGGIMIANILNSQLDNNAIPSASLNEMVRPLAIEGLDLKRLT